MHGSWFTVHGSWLGVQGSGCRVQGAGFRVWGPGVRAYLGTVATHPGRAFEEPPLLSSTTSTTFAVCFCGSTCIKSTFQYRRDGAYAKSGRCLYRRRQTLDAYYVVNIIDIYRYIVHHAYNFDMTYIRWRVLTWMRRSWKWWWKAIESAESSFNLVPGTAQSSLI